MAIKNKYRQSSEGSIASYDFTDIAEGTGIIAFQGFEIGASGAGSATYGLTTNNFFSNMVESSGGGTYEQDFDLAPFNLPKAIKGTGYTNITWSARDGSGTCTPYAMLRKWDGTTETEIAQASGGAQNNNSGTPITVLLKIPQIPLTHFKKGEQLRLTAGVEKTTGTGHPVLAHDPQNRDGIWIKPSTNASTTKLQLFVPFVLDL